MKKIYDSEQTPIFQDEEWNPEYFITWMEADLKIPGNIVFSIKDSLFTTDGETIQLIATQENSTIQVFHQLTAWSMIVPDLANRCLLLLDRNNSKFSSYAGDCNPSYGNGKRKDGNKVEAKTSLVLDIVRGRGQENSQKLFFIDMDYYDDNGTALRIVDVSTQYVKTLYRFDRRGLALCWENGTRNILLGGLFGIRRLNLDEGEIEQITVASEGRPSSTANIYDIRNGPLTDAAFLKPRGIINIVENTYVTASDLGLQVFDLTINYMQSVCTLSDSQSIREGNITFCQTPSDVGTPLYFDGHLYFSSSTHDYVQIAQLEGKDFVLTLPNHI